MSNACVVSEHGLNEFNKKYFTEKVADIKVRMDDNMDYDITNEARKRKFDILKIDNDFKENNRCSGHYDENDEFTDYGFSEKVDRSRGRPRMQHPTKVYGEITRPWTPVFALLEHKYIDKKVNNCEITM
ncbi:uncharacterized protein LOC128548984 [Mercenaria mercenaria]|uniref:uncharacterized protein LOC128548984 n=1 Tax=Mercenaria mercenaria TaxID=6596 RepID=UPI00234F6CEF|nr:uncharacterized protein LOC128548984 [Mercenaria mercenaria]